MKRRESAQPATEALPAELERFDFDEWTIPEDVEAFAEWEQNDSVKAGEIGERRWAFLTIKARQRWKAARAVWRGEHLGEPVSHVYAPRSIESAPQPWDWARGK